MPEPVFSPGFRFSLRDVVVLVLGAVLSVLILLEHLWIGIAIGFVVLHFFLFCNVLRISRPAELLWAAVFSCLAVGATIWGVPVWPMVFVASLALTIVIGFVEIRRVSYHGICWQLINPGLPGWCSAHITERVDTVNDGAPD